VEAEQWTQAWIDDWSGRPRDWTVEGDRRPRALDITEVAIRRPSAFRATGEMLRRLIARRGWAQDRLAEVDRRLAVLVDERRALVARIEGCNLAIAGTGILGAGHTSPVQRLANRQFLPFDDPMPPAASGLGVASGHRLRVAIQSLLLATEQALTLVELERLLRLQGLAVGGRPSQTLVNALRPALADGTVVRTGRGSYRAG
jgi:hypothetical protein